MILTCPECSARYLVGPQALLPNGRMVRCAKCRHSWREAAPDIDVPVVDKAGENLPDTEQIPDTSAPSGNTPSVGEEDEFSIRRARRKKRQRPLPKGSNLPALQNHNHGGSLRGWYGLAAFVAVIIASFLIFQDRISELWPPSQKLYHTLGMESHNSGTAEQAAEHKKPERSAQALFKIKDTTLDKGIIDGVMTLKIDGNIINLTDEDQSLPLLRISLKDDQNKVIRKWTFKTSAATILPDEKVAFSTSLPNPPDDATSISVTFAVK